MLAYVSNTKQPQSGSQWFTITKSTTTLMRTSKKLKKLCKLNPRIIHKTQLTTTTEIQRFRRPLLERHCCKEMEVFRSMFAKLTDLSVGWIQVVEKNQPWTPTLRVWLVVVDVTCKLLLGGERQKASTLLHIHSDHLRSSLIPVISENLRNRLRMVALLFTHTFRDR